MCSCLAVFFLTVRGTEKVLVPDVTGKELTSALLEMQAKELYPKIQLRYTESQNDAGKILTQSPSSGAIVKAGTRVSLTVSKGAVVTEVGNYIGKNFDELKLDLTTMFSGYSRPLIVLADPVYRANQAEVGTILEQDPKEGTPVSEPVTVRLIISRGPTFENTKISDYTGLSVQEMLSRIPQSKLIFDFSAHTASPTEKEGTVSSQQKFATDFVPNYTHVAVELALPNRTVNGLVYGIFEANIALYPYPVAMTIEAIPPEKERYTMLEFNHTGGKLTVPYALAPGTEIILRVAGREITNMYVE